MVGREDNLSLPAVDHTVGDATDKNKVLKRFKGAAKRCAEVNNFLRENGANTAKGLELLLRRCVHIQRSIDERLVPVKNQVAIDSNDAIRNVATKDESTEGVG